MMCLKDVFGRSSHHVETNAPEQSIRHCSFPLLSQMQTPISHESKPVTYNQHRRTSRSLEGKIHEFQAIFFITRSQRPFDPRLSKSFQYSVSILKNNWMNENKRFVADGSCLSFGEMMTASSPSQALRSQHCSHLGGRWKSSFRILATLPEGCSNIYCRITFPPQP